MCARIHMLDGILNGLSSQKYTKTTSGLHTCFGKILDESENELLHFSMGYDTITRQQVLE